MYLHFLLYCTNCGLIFSLNPALNLLGPLAFDRAALIVNTCCDLALFFQARTVVVLHSRKRAFVSGRMHDSSLRSQGRGRAEGRVGRARARARARGRRGTFGQQRRIQNACTPQSLTGHETVDCRRTSWAKSSVDATSLRKPALHSDRANPALRFCVEGRGGLLP